MLQYRTDQAHKTDTMITLMGVLVKTSQILSSVDKAGTSDCVVIY